MEDSELEETADSNLHLLSERETLKRDIEKRIWRRHHAQLIVAIEVQRLRSSVVSLKKKRDELQKKRIAEAMRTTRIAHNMQELELIPAAVRSLRSQIVSLCQQRDANHSEFCLLDISAQRKLGEALYFRKEAGDKSSGRSSDALLLKGTLVEEAERTVWLEGKEAELRAGTTAEVIEWLIVNPSDAHRFFDTFLLVSSKFIPAHEVLFRLRENYDQSYKYETHLRAKMVQFLNYWMSHFPDTFFSDNQLVESAKNFAKYQLAETSAGIANSLLNSLKSKAPGERQEEAERLTCSNMKLPPMPITPKRGIRHILDIDPRELARQVTIRDYNVFSAISASELLSLNWMQKDKEKKAPNLMKMIHNFNRFASWIRSSIVKEPNPKTRVETLSAWIAVAEVRIHGQDSMKTQAFHHMRNYHALVAVVSALTSSIVFRLKQTWEKVPHNRISQYSEVVKVAASDHNHKHYRHIMKVATADPRIPHIAVTLSDLTFVEEDILREVRSCQRIPFNYEKIDEVQKFIEYVQPLEESEQYRLSKAIEPSNNGAKSVSSPSRSRAAMLSWSPTRKGATKDYKHGKRAAKEDSFVVGRSKSEESPDWLRSPLRRRKKDGGTPTSSRDNSISPSRRDILQLQEEVDYNMSPSRSSTSSNNTSCNNEHTVEERKKDKRGKGKGKKAGRRVK